MHSLRTTLITAVLAGLSIAGSTYAVVDITTVYETTRTGASQPLATTELVFTVPMPGGDTEELKLTTDADARIRGLPPDAITDADGVVTVRRAGQPTARTSLEPYMDGYRLIEPWPAPTISLIPESFALAAGLNARFGEQGPLSTQEYGAQGRLGVGQLRMRRVVATFALFCLLNAAVVDYDYYQAGESYTAPKFGGGLVSLMRYDAVPLLLVARAGAFMMITSGLNLYQYEGSLGFLAELGPLAPAACLTVLSGLTLEAGFWLRGVYGDLDYTYAAVPDDPAETGGDDPTDTAPVDDAPVDPPAEPAPTPDPPADPIVDPYVDPYVDPIVDPIVDPRDPYLAAYNPVMGPSRAALLGLAAAGGSATGDISETDVGAYLQLGTSLTRRLSLQTGFASNGDDWAVYVECSHWFPFMR